MFARRTGSLVGPILRGTLNAARKSAGRTNSLKGGVRTKMASMVTQAVVRKSSRAAGKLLLLGAATAVGAAGAVSYFRLHAADQDTTQVGVLPKHGIEKTKEQIKLITEGIESNRLFRLLDDEQKKALIQVLTRIEFKEGDVVLRQGDQGDHFYIIERGQAEVTSETGEAGRHVHLRTLGPGQSFGEQGMFLNTTRSATVLAKTPLVAWVVSKELFMDYVLPSSSRVRALFDKYASQRGPKGQLLMTPYDFLRALRYESETTILTAEIDAQSKSRLNYLFDLAKRDRDHPGMNISEFAVFDAILSKPDSEFDIAFLLFDKGKDGLISKDDVVATLRTMQAEKAFRFNESCDLMRRFFGDDGKHKLRFPEFTQFFVNLTEEIPRQLFQFYDKDHTGHISGEQFAELLKSFGNWRLPEGVQKRLETLKSLHYDRPVVTYAEFVTFNSFLNHLPALDGAIAEACKNRIGGLTRDEFHRTVLPQLATNVSPLEVDIVFSIFDVDGDGRIDHRDFHCVMHYGRACSQSELDATLARKPAQPAVASGQHSLKDMTPLERMLDAATNFGMGAIAGGAGAFAVYPIDLVKTRMQNQRAVVAAQRLYKNSFHCFWVVLSKEGPLGLYRGLLPQLMGVAPEKAIKLTVNDFLRGLFEDRSKGSIYFPLEVLAGCGAGASQVIFTNPIEIVKIRLQVQGETQKLDPTYKPKGSVTIIRELGLTGLYKGAGACLLRDVPFSGIYFPAYAATKKWLARDKNGKNDATDLLLAGAIAGIPAASLVTPADVIKTRLQVEARKGEQTYTGIRDCFWKVLRDEGPRAFMKGAMARVFRSSPQFGVTLLVYEQLHRMLGPDHVEGYRPPTSAPITKEDLEALRSSESRRNVERFESKIQTLKS